MYKNILLVIFLLLLFSTTSGIIQHVEIDTTKSVYTKIDTTAKQIQQVELQQTIIFNKIDILKKLVIKDKKLTYEQKEQLKGIIGK